MADSSRLDPQSHAEIADKPNIMASQLATSDIAAPAPSLLRRVRGAFGVTARKGMLGLFDQAIVSGTSFITTVIVGRFCGPEQLGVYSLGFTLLVFIAVVQESLVSAPYTVFVSRKRGVGRARYAGSVLGHYLVLAAIASAGLACAAVAAGPVLRPILWLLAGIVPFTLLREFGRRMCFAHLNLRGAMIVDTVVAAVQLSLLTALIVTDRLTPVTVYMAIGCATAVAGIGWLFYMRSRLIVALRRVRVQWRRSWRFGRWVMAAQATAVVDQYVIFWIVAALIDATATGVLAACMTMIHLANPIILGVSNVFEPRAAQAFADEGHAELKRVTCKVMLLMGGAMTAFALVIGVFGDPIMQLIYGDGYGGQHITIALLAAAFALSAATAPAGDALRVIERPKVNFLATMAGLIVSAASIAWWSMLWGLVGAAGGFLAGVVACSAIQLTAFAALVGRAQSDALSRR